jgi:hypothetical protein
LFAEPEVGTGKPRGKRSEHRVELALRHLMTGVLIFVVADQYIVESRPHPVLKLPLDSISDDSPGMQKILWIEAATVQVSQLSNTRHAVQL